MRLYILNVGTNHFTFVRSKHQPNQPIQYLPSSSIYRSIGNSGERDTWSFLALLELNTDHMLSEVSKTLFEGSVSTLSWHGSCRVQCSSVALCQYWSDLALCFIKRWGRHCRRHNPHLPGTWLCEGIVCTAVQWRMSTGPMAQLLVWCAQLFCPVSSSFNFLWMK